ncbi:MAG: hypothetical protein ACI9EF_002514 [Pseudohongiellaceae bacterium]|jgi:hypothetical protein
MFRSLVATIATFSLALLAVPVAAQQSSASAQNPQLGQVSGTAAAAATGTPPRIFGVDAVAIDLATVSIQMLPNGKQALKVSNLGSSGCDGVSIAAPHDGVESMSVTFEPTTTALPTETVSVEFDAMVDGAAPVLVGTVDLRLQSHPVDGDVWHLSVDSSPLGAASHTVSIMDQGYLSQTISLAAGDELIIGAYPKETYYFENIDDPENSVFVCIVLEKPSKIVGIQHGGGGTTPLNVMATALKCVADIQTPNTLELTEMRVLSADTGEIYLSGISQGFAGAQITGTDEALVEHTAGKLKVSNLGSSGCDGFSISPGGNGGGQSADGGSLLFDPLNNGGVIPPGATFTVKLAATVQGELHEDFASIKATKDPLVAMDRIEFGCDPNMVGVTWFYELYLAGQLVVQGDPTLIQSFTMGNHLDSLNGVYYGNGPPAMGDMDGDGIALTMAGPQTANIDGMVYQCDELRLVIPDSEAWRVSAINAVVIEATDLGEFSVTTALDKATPKLNLGHLQVFRGHVTILKEPLSLGGSMEVGSTSALMLDDAPAGQFGILFLSLDVNPTSLKGASLITFPIWAMLNLFTDQTGGIDLPFVWPQGIPAGFELYAQIATTGSSPGGPVWMSNGIALIGQ